MGKFVDAPENLNWRVWKNDDGTYTADAVTWSLLMDIRRELRQLNQLLRCPNFLDIPSKLDRIARNTAKPKRKKAAKKRG